MIPKKVHYCWFGNNPKSQLIKNCIASWKKYLPDWEVIEWNEENYDVNKNAYVREAYDQRKWAFVVDFARFDILDNYGGVFFDADVELLKPIPDALLTNHAFTGFESAGRVAPGLVFAAEPGHYMLKEIMNVYQTKSFGEKRAGREETIVDIVTEVLVNKGLVNNNQMQTVSDIVIYPQEYFCCFDHETQNFEISEETVSIHHYAASWSPWHRKAYFRTIKYVAKILGKDNYLCMKRRIQKILK